MGGKGCSKQTRSTQGSSTCSVALPGSEDARDVVKRGTMEVGAAAGECRVIVSLPCRQSLMTRQAVTRSSCSACNVWRRTLTKEQVQDSMIGGSTIKAVAVTPGNADSLHLSELPRQSLREIEEARGVLVQVGRGIWTSIHAFFDPFRNDAPPVFAAALKTQRVPYSPAGHWLWYERCVSLNPKYTRSVTTVLINLSITYELAGFASSNRSTSLRR